MQESGGEPVVEILAAATLAPDKWRLRQAIGTVRRAVNAHMEMVIVPIPRPHFAKLCAVAAALPA